jgi:hypothetical protein
MKGFGGETWGKKATLEDLGVDVDNINVDV